MDSRLSVEYQSLLNDYTIAHPSLSFSILFLMRVECILYKIK